MQFNQKALEFKMKFLDKISEEPETIDKVVKRNICSEYKIRDCKRIWVGGGASSYVIDSVGKKFFLKIKHKAVTVESKFEEEKDFINESCIKHEKNMLQNAAKAGVNTPEIIFFDTEGEFQFLATSYIPDSLLDALEKASVEEILNLWDYLV